MVAGGSNSDGSAATSASYLPAVDGLRALAILLVVLYHAGVPWIPGGFIGVDVFFVISGFLIMSQIAEGLRKGDFSYVTFWSRRAIRILPPYALVLVAAMLAAPFLLFLPDELQDFGYEIGASAALQANHFYLAEQGYFERGAETRVLLHLWSLGVEEQFYVVASPIMAAAWFTARRSRRARAVALAIGAAILATSLAGCILFTGIEGGRNHAFFLMPLRAWEFIAGGAVATVIPSVMRLPRPMLEGLGLAGLAAVLGSGFLLSSHEPFPSWRAAVPVAATCLVLLAALANTRIAAARLLSLPIMTAIGLVSYSWYLWHWPLLTLARMSRFGERDLAIDLLLVGVAFCLAIATYLLVERPLREWRRQQRIDWRPGAAIIAGCIGLGAIGLGAYSFAATSQTRAAEGISGPRSVRADPDCDIAAMRTIEDCVDDSVDGYGIVLGDSQAGAVTGFLQKLARKHSLAVVAAASGGCVPLHNADLRIPDATMANRCAKIRDTLSRMASDGTLAPTFAIIVARWQLYVEPTSGYGLAGSPGDLDDGRKRAALVAGLDGTVEMLHAAGAKRILIIGPGPEFVQPAPRCVALSDRLDIDRDLKCSHSREVLERENAAAASWIGEVAAAHDFVRVVDPMEAFCTGERCRSFGGERIFFRDTHHLSGAGMRAIQRRAHHDFDWMLSANRQDTAD